MHARLVWSGDGTYVRRRDRSMAGARKNMRVRIPRQWNPSNQDSLKQGHLDKQDSFCCPKCHVCVHYNH